MKIRTDADIAAGLAALTLLDERLADVIAFSGTVSVRVGRAGLAGLCHIVVGQQVSRASAMAIFARLDAAVDLDDPGALLEASDATLTAAGLSTAKRRTMRALGRAVLAGELDFAQLEGLPAEAAIAEMVRVPGIGPWTAECWLLFCSGHPDVFPAGDLALQVAVGHAFGLPERPSAKALKAMAGIWSPHRTTAAHLFWRYYARVTAREAAPQP